MDEPEDLSTSTGAGALPVLSFDRRFSASEGGGLLQPGWSTQGRAPGQGLRQDAWASSCSLWTPCAVAVPARGRPQARRSRPAITLSRLRGGRRYVHGDRDDSGGALMSARNSVESSLIVPSQATATCW